MLCGQGQINDIVVDQSYPRARNKTRSKHFLDPLVALGQRHDDQVEEGEDGAAEEEAEVPADLADEAGRVAHDVLVAHAHHELGEVEVEGVVGRLLEVRLGVAQLLLQGLVARLVLVAGISD